ncbi:MAG: aminotransferase class V-fold PLP-dependent enzyme [Alphaproteobacteria bacterium]|nr:aminotransferase class V-fold PLP-dependent enzyme [Alphaproteobacteria bacterium]
MTDPLKQTLDRIVAATLSYRAGVAGAPQRAAMTYEEMRARFAAPLPEHGAPTEAVIAELIEQASPGIAAMTGPRFFAWVIGATHEAGMAADWLTSAWGQNAGNQAATPAAAAAEETAAAWLLDLLDLPRGSSVGFVTGATMANFTGLAAARGEVLARAGWDAEGEGLFGAPPVTVILGEEAHATVFAALKYLGLGDRRVTRVKTDRQGRMIVADVERALAAAPEGPIIVIAQAGHLNTGAFDDFAAIIPRAKERGAWVHVDGAFGLWARTVPALAEQAKGIDLADSWASDGHKWLQTPHDCGYVIVRDRRAHLRAMRMATSYLPFDESARNPVDYVPELSRRARGFATWAMVKALGRAGIAAMVERHCALARRFAERLSVAPDVAVLNEVVLNQLAVRFGSNLPDAEADRLAAPLIARIQQDGECFVGGATHQGLQIVRVSVIGFPTTEADIDRAAAAMLSAWEIVKQAGA